MVRCIVIPHDQGRCPRLRELPDLGAFQAVVGGSLEPLEIPALDVTVYMNEAERLRWYYSAQPADCPVILGDVVLTRNGHDAGEDGGDVPEAVTRLVFGIRRFVVQGTPHGDGCWHDTYALFDNLFDAALWCMLFTATLRPGPQFRIAVDDGTPNLAPGEPLLGGAAPW